jgi:ubiquinone/menaquinone biosynthesis C-methylase UbiE
MAVIDRAVIEYYDRLAPTYEAERFGNSYGKFLDAQERATLTCLLPMGARVLDLGCGTGRLTDFATHGCDASIASVKIAARRHSNKAFVAGDATSLPFRSDSFDAAFGFHVLMHLSPAAIGMVLAEVGRVLKPEAIFIADVASGFRRRLHPRRCTQWHGATSLTRREFERLAAPAGLKLRATAGIALVPVHRVPPRFRRFLTDLDRRLAALAPDWASYIVGCFAKERAP